MLAIDQRRGLIYVTITRTRELPEPVSPAAPVSKTSASV
jgi:hypothetical protein